VFGGHAGSLLALTGTPVNVLVSEAAADAGFGSFGYFEFALAGIPLVVGTVVIAMLFGQRLLPHRRSQTIPPDLSRHARTLVEQYRLEDGVFQLRLRPGSPLIGMPRTAIDVSDRPGLALVGAQDGKDGRPLRRLTLAEGDMLVVRGDAESAGALAADQHLAFRSEDGGDVADVLFNRASGLAEVVIPPRSGFVGQAVFPGMVTPSGDLVVLAVQRRGLDQGPGETFLAAGDTLLLQGTWKALDERLDTPDVLVVDSPELVRRQAVPMGGGAWQAVAVLAVMVILPS
jgi:di/tricarboxylate transporter